MMLIEIFSVTLKLNQLQVTYLVYNLYLELNCSSTDRKYAFRRLPIRTNL